MPPRNNTLCFPRRILELSIAACFFVFFILSVLVYHWAMQGSIAASWAGYAIFATALSLPPTIACLFLAYFETSTRQWELREPNALCARLWAWIKSLCSCQKSNGQEPSASTAEDLSPSSPEPTNFSSNSTKENVEMANLNPEPQAHCSSKPDPTDGDSEDSVGWSCLMCNFCKKSNDKESSPTTTEFLTPSTTEPTASTSSKKEEIEMSNLNPEPQASTSRQMPMDASENPSRWGCLKRCLTCKNSDSQEATETTDELMPSSSDPTFYSSSSQSEGIEMANIIRQLAEAKSSSENMESSEAAFGPSTSANVEREMDTLNRQQAGPSSKQMIDSANEESSDISIETTL